MRRTLIVVGIVVAVLALLLVVVAIIGPVDPVRTSDDPESLAAGWVTLGPIEASVESLEPIASQPDVYLGLAAPVPTWDTSELGPDLSFTDSEPYPASLTEEAVRAVYLGKDIEGVDFYVFQQGSNSFLNLIGQILLDRTVGRFGTTYGCCASGSATEEERSFPLLSIETLGNGPSFLIAEWHALPEDVVVVAFRVGEQAFGWQRVIGGSAAIRLEVDQATDPNSIELVALNESGDEVAVYPADL